MGVCKSIVILGLILIPVSLPAQQNGTGSSAGTSSSGSSTGISTGISTDDLGVTSSFQGVENASEQASSGNFVGSGAPSAFVGVDEIYAGSSASSRSSSSSAQRTVSRTRTARTAASRRTASMGSGMGTRISSNTGQSVRATVTADFEVPLQSSLEHRINSGAIESGLRRITGLRNTEITLERTPTGTAAVLTGSAAAERERRVAQQLLLMEPGISRVENLMLVRPLQNQ